MFANNSVKKPLKEASKGQKVIHADNVATLGFYRLLIGCSLAIFSIITYIMRYDAFTTRYMVLSSACLITCLSAYKFMSFMATPTYGNDDRGVRQLQDAGLDLNMGPGSVGEHAKDLIIACCFVSILSLLHRYFWFLLLAIPIRGFYMLWVNIIAPWVFDPGQEQQVNEKKQKKMERKMRRLGHLSR